MYFYLIIITIIAIDQISKNIVIALLANTQVNLVPNILSLVLVKNFGAAFGIMQNWKWFFLIATPLVCLFLIYLFLTNKKNISNAIVFSLIIGGAMGNFFDRAIYGYVVDFIYIKKFPVFNFADSCIVIGATIYIFSIIFTNGKKKEIIEEIVEEEEDKNEIKK